MIRGKTIRLAAVLGVMMSWAALCQAQNAAPADAAALVAAVQTAPAAPSTVVLDRVVAVVNNRAILASDLDDEMRLAVLDPGEGGQVLTTQRALEQLISRTLIQQQIRQEDAEAAEAPLADVQARIQEIRRELPACVRLNCVTEEGWKRFLREHGLTAEQVENSMRRRIQILRFIEVRFRQGIRIDPKEIGSYYRETLLPQYSAGETPPPLDQVAPRIEEILLQQQVNVLFDGWLTNLRKQGDVEVLDPALEISEPPVVPAADGKGGA